MNKPVRNATCPRLGMALTVTAAILGGCASVSKDAGFADVQKTAAEKLQKDVQWNKGMEQDKAAAKAVQALLERPLSVDDAVQIALLNNPGLQAAYEDLGIAQADLVQAGLLKNPVFSGDILALGPAHLYSASVVQDFLSVLTLAGRKRVASSQFERRKFEVANRVMDLAAAVRSAYYKALADEQSLDLFKQVVSATEAAAELGERQREAGNIMPRDQAIQQAFYAQTLLDRSRIETQLAADREVLNKLMGLWGKDVAWNTPERLPDVPEEKPAIDGLETLAVEQRLDLAAAKMNLEAANYALNLGEDYRYLSIFGLGMALEMEPDGLSYGPRLQFGLPLFDQGQAQIALLEAQQRKHGRMVTNLGVDIRAEVRDAWTRMNAAQDAVRHYEKVLLPLNQQIVAENQRLYNGMLVGPYELLLSKQNELNVARDYIHTIRDYWIAQSDLEHAIGGPLPGKQVRPRPDEKQQPPTQSNPQDEHQHGNPEK